MAFDGLFLSALISEFKETILGGKIAKIIQSEKDELQITVKATVPSSPLCQSLYSFDLS